MNLQDVRDKVSAMRSACLNLAAECDEMGPTPGLNYRQISIDAYMEAFDALEAAVEGYISDTATKAADLEDMVTAVATLVLTGRDDIVPESLWEYYSADSMFNVLLQFSDDHFFDGCMTSEESVPEAIEVFTTALGAAEQADHALREALNRSFISSSLRNGHRALFEEAAVFDYPEYTKRQLSDKVYIEKGIREIILAYDLGLYIPSYYEEVE